MNDRVATIKGRRFEVRAIFFDSRTFFCVKDILSVCGIRCPARWVARERGTRSSDLQMMKLMYPMMTKAGRREYAMWFVDAGSGKRMIDMTSCTDDTKKWLSEDVFTYLFPVSSTEPAREAELPDPPAGERPDLNRRIDSILIELLELKKIIIQQNV